MIATIKRTTYDKSFSPRCISPTSGAAVRDDLQFRFRVNRVSLTCTGHFRSSPDCVAKLQKWLAAFFPQKEKPSENRQSICPQARYRSCRWDHHLLLWSPARLFDRRAHSPENLSPVIQKEFCNPIPPTTDMWRPLRHVR
jgi:hypothetical protein